ncbi:MAG TPA: hypothetical protein VFM76_06015 [Methylophaga sp.]|nr:hypothetical protein [Methylophaga sp.]
MSTIPAMQSAYEGIQTGLQSAARSTAKIASAGTNGGDLTTPIVELKQAELQVAASAKVMQASTDMLGSLLDIQV